MIDCKTYNEIIDLLDKGELKKLRKYVESENKKIYLPDARRAFKQYLAKPRKPGISRGYYDYEEFTMCQLFVTDYCSAYFLKSAEILTPAQKKKASGIFHKSSLDIMDLYNKYEKELISVEKVERVDDKVRDKSPIIDLWTKDGGIHTFYEEEFSFAEKFLGDDVDYSVSTVGPKLGSVCLVKSKKGTGFICGKRYE